MSLLRRDLPSWWSGGWERIIRVLLKRAKLVSTTISQSCAMYCFLPLQSSSLERILPFPDSKEVLSVIVRNLSVFVLKPPTNADRGKTNMLQGYTKVSLFVIILLIAAQSNLNSVKRSSVLISFYIHNHQNFCFCLKKIYQ